MSYYYNYDFVSPEPIYAIIREELKSYMDAGEIDDLMFSTYVDKCLRKLGRSGYLIREKVLDVVNFTSDLPDDFYAVREAWFCTRVEGDIYQSPTSRYNAISRYITLVSKDSSIRQVYLKKYLLKPGNISAVSSCDANYISNWKQYSQSIPDSSSYDSFDIRDGKFLTNFRRGIVNLIYYSFNKDIEGSQLGPNNYRVMEYIESYIKYKMFESLLNQVTDERINQIERKLQYYKQASDEAYILAEIELKKQTVWDKQRRIKRDMHRFDMYELPTTYTGRRRRRNL
jgi:hypothetical protein